MAASVNPGVPRDASGDRRGRWVPFRVGGGAGTTSASRCSGRTGGSPTRSCSKTPSSASNPARPCSEVRERSKALGIEVEDRGRAPAELGGQVQVRYRPAEPRTSRSVGLCRLTLMRIAGVGYSDTYALPSIFIRGTAPISARRCQASVQGSRSIDLAWSAIARDEPCAACRNTRSGLPGRIRYLSLRSAPAGFRARYNPVNGADGDARQGHRFVGAAARGRTTWARAAAQAPGQCMRNPERPARPRSGCADRKAEWRGGADGIAAQRHRGDGGRERAGRA